MFEYVILILYSHDLLCCAELYVCACTRVLRDSSFAGFENHTLVHSTTHHALFAVLVFAVENFFQFNSLYISLVFFGDFSKKPNRSKCYSVICFLNSFW